MIVGMLSRNNDVGSGVNSVDGLSCNPADFPSTFSTTFSTNIKPIFPLVLKQRDDNLYYPVLDTGSLIKKLGK